MQKKVITKITPALLIIFLFLCMCTFACKKSDTAEKTDTALKTDTAEKTEKAVKPNILLIIGDDFGVDVTSNMYPGLIDDLIKKYGPEGYNHPDYQKIKGSPASTPGLDKLAKEGMSFTNVWAHPFCSPTRAAILTGLFNKKAKVLTYADALSQNHTTFVQKLRDEGGYSTGLFGKWHLAGMPGRNGSPDFPGIKPKEAGFDIFKGNLNAAIKSYWDYDYQIQDDSTPANEWRAETAPEKSLPGIAPSNYAPLVKVADTLEWITKNEKENPDKPWFAWLAFNLSHATIIQQPNAMAVPNADTLDKESLDEMNACGGKFGSNDAGNCSDVALMRAMTNSMDTLMGKLLDAVNELDPNTYVIYISDNGTPMYNMRGGLNYIDNMYITKQGRGKGTAYESGALVPMVIKGPGIKPNSKNSGIAHAADLFSTTLALAGLEIPGEVNSSDGNEKVTLDSVSLAPILFNDKETVRDPDKGYVLTESINLMTNGTKHVGARNAKYKIVCAGSIEESNNCSFYNIKDDPIEEYPLDKPESCQKYTDGSWTPENPEWNYCRLMEVIKEDSYISEYSAK